MSTNNRNNTRFLRRQRPKLKKRLIDHLTLREKEITSILHNTILHLSELGYQCSSTVKTSKYAKSFIDMGQINKLINDWKGLQITRDISEAQYHNKSVNWLDQNSKKVSGPYFFALHFKEIRSYLLNYCKHINVAETEKKHILNYSCIYFIVQLLSAKVTGFTRCKSQPLIRNTTLAKDKSVHNSFKCLCNLDLIKLAKIVKKKRKHEIDMLNAAKTTKPKKQNRIDCKEFAKQLQIYCNNLLNEQKSKLGLSVSSNSAPLIPAYFQESDSERKDMDLDMDSNNCTDYVSSDGIQSQEPLSTETVTHFPNMFGESPAMMDIPPPVSVGYNASNMMPLPAVSCVCEDSYGVPTLPIHTMPTFYEPIIPMNNMYQSYRYYDVYRGFRGAYYNYGATQHMRHSPYGMPPQAYDSNVLPLPHSGGNHERHPFASGFY